MAALTRAISGVSWSAALRLLGGAEERRSSSNAVSPSADGTGPEGRAEGGAEGLGAGGGETKGKPNNFLPPSRWGSLGEIVAPVELGSSIFQSKRLTFFLMSFRVGATVDGCQNVPVIPCESPAGQDFVTIHSTCMVHVGGASQGVSLPYQGAENSGQP